MLKWLLKPIWSLPKSKVLLLLMMVSEKLLNLSSRFSFIQCISHIKKWEYKVRSFENTVKQCKCSVLFSPDSRSQPCDLTVHFLSSLVFLLHSLPSFSPFTWLFRRSVTRSLSIVAMSRDLILGINSTLLLWTIWGKFRSLK